MSLERFKERLNLTLVEVGAFLGVDPEEESQLQLYVDSAIETVYEFMGNDFLESVEGVDFETIMGSKREPWYDRNSSKVPLENENELEIPKTVRLAVLEIIRIDFSWSSADRTIKEEKVGGVTLKFSSPEDAVAMVLKNRLDKYKMKFFF
jgi:hypothetical protein